MIPRLTPRRREALLLALRGYTMEETAKIMKITLETVKHHRIGACSHFNTWNIAVAGALAVRDGYFTPEELALIGAYQEKIAA